jgi:hypothetical protein
MEIALGIQLSGIVCLYSGAIKKFQRSIKHFAAKLITIKSILFDKSIESQCPAQSIDATEHFDTVAYSISLDLGD